MQEIKETSSYRKALKEKIMETAMEAFFYHGIRAVRMDDIASGLGISKRTLYEIYKDKEELLSQGIIAYEQKKQEYIREYARQGHHAIDIVMEAYRMKVHETRMVNPAFYEDIMKYPQVESYIKKEHERTREGTRQFLHRGVQEGYFRSNVNHELITHLFDAIGQHIISCKLLRSYTMRELFINLFLVSLRGMCTEKGVKTLDEAIAKI